MIDFTTTLSEHFVLVVVVACLIIGYVIKHSTLLKKIPNNDIPAILAVVGAILNAAVSGISVEKRVSEYAMAPTQESMPVQTDMMQSYACKKTEQLSVTDLPRYIVVILLIYVVSVATTGS